jgi:hypothetical protein
MIRLPVHTAGTTGLEEKLMVVESLPVHRGLNGLDPDVLRPPVRRLSCIGMG